MLKVHARKWGNSIGVIIPREGVKEFGIRPHDELVIEIKGKSANVLKELFGSLRWSKHPRELLKEARAELESKY